MDETGLVRVAPVADAAWEDLQPLRDLSELEGRLGLVRSEWAQGG